MGTRDSYDAVADDYQRLVGSELPGKVFDRAMLRAFAELIALHGSYPVADIGCGPGHVTAHLVSLGVNAFGLDLSPAMVEIACRSHPELRFDVGSMTDLSLPDATLGGIVARYSTIHLTPIELPVALAEFHRVLRPGGSVLVDFQVGDERIKRTEAYGRPVSLTTFRRPVALMVEALVGTGFELVAQLTRAPDDRETVLQCHLIARRPA